MGAAYFYHLTRSPVEQTLPMLLARALSAGWRCEVRGTQADRLSHLDDVLWTAQSDSFLPHGLAGGPQADDQPILLTVTPQSSARTACVLLIDGADTTPAEVDRLERTCVIFDGNNPDALTGARALWKTLADADLPLQYWAESSGGWQKKSER